MHQQDGREHTSVVPEWSQCVHLVQVWGAKDVFYDNLNACKQVGNAILGFHEPELSSGASMSVQVSFFALLSHHIVDRHCNTACARPHEGISGCIAWSMSVSRSFGRTSSNNLQWHGNSVRECPSSGLLCMLRSKMPCRVRA